MIIEERRSTHVYRQKQLFGKEELEARESACVHEQSAYCNAACPLKLDTKAMMAAVAAGDFTKALALYDKITPFPHILSAGCEAPCEGKCKLCALGEGIAIRQLEAAAVQYGEMPRKKGFLRKKTKKCAVFGTDLFSLFLAGELAKKMYPVTVYTEHEDDASLIAAVIPMLPAPIQEASVAALKKMDIQFVWNADVTAAYAEPYDLKCASYEVANMLHPDLAVDEAVMVAREYKLITVRLRVSWAPRSVLRKQRSLPTVWPRTWIPAIPEVKRAASRPGCIPIWKASNLQAESSVTAGKVLSPRQAAASSATAMNALKAVPICSIIRNSPAFSPVRSTIMCLSLWATI